MNFLSDLFTNPFSFLFWAVALVVSVDVHEFAHAWVADKLGDPTPRVNDRLTLNPIAHLDPIGTLALLIFHIGWGKPVPIDPFNLKDPRRDTALISLAGPASNLVLAGILSSLLRLPGVMQVPILPTLLLTTIILSVGLAIFNLIPVPPLDGSKILFGLLPRETAIEWEENLNQYGLIILIFLLFPFFGNQPLIGIIVWPIINFVLGILLPPGLFLPMV